MANFGTVYWIDHRFPRVGAVFDPSNGMGQRQDVLISFLFRVGTQYGFVSIVEASFSATSGAAFFKHDLSGDELLPTFSTGFSQLSLHKAGSATLFLPSIVG